MNADFWDSKNWHHGPPRSWIQFPGSVPSGVFTVNNQELSAAQVLSKIRMLEQRIEELESPPSS